MLLIGEAKRSGVPDLIEIPAGTNLRTLGRLKVHLLVDWLELKKRVFMQGPVGKLLSQVRGFLFDYNWEPTREDGDRVVLDVEYEAERFKMEGKGDQEELAENMANALKEGVERIDTWFEECINDLEAK